jgi:BASS family bile acid:Na+ symporter
MEAECRFATIAACGSDYRFNTTIKRTTMRALAALSRFVGNTFAYWVLIFAVLAFLEPAWFVGLKGYIVPLLGVVMFGMGLTLKLEDFAEVARHPWRVALGVVAHFVIMPGVAWLLCQVFHLSAAAQAAHRPTS